MNATYDALGRITNFSNVDKRNNIVASFQYEYDKSSNVTKIIDSNNNIFEFSYDARNELIKDNNASYTYDKMGNRISLVTNNKTPLYYNAIKYFYDAKDTNRLIRALYQNSRYFDYSYDDNGNLIKKVDSKNGTTSYSYNADNYFTKAVLPDGTSVEYQYDPITKLRSARIAIDKNNNKTIIKFVYDADRLVSETDADGKVLKTYSWDENENLISVTMPDSLGAQQTYFYLKNAKGDIIGISDQNGDKLAEYEYDSWGNITKSVTVNQKVAGNFDKLNNRLYAGYWFDRDLGLYFMKIRMYDPSIGRFLSVDPVVSGNDSLSLNPYIYCGNNPIDRVDPSGKGWLSKAIGYVGNAVRAATKVIQQVWAPVSNAIANFGNLPINQWIRKNPAKTYFAACGIQAVIGAAIVGALYAPQIAATTYVTIVNQGKSISQLITGSIGKAELYGERLVHVVERHSYGTVTNASKFPQGWDAQKIKTASEAVANNRALQTLPNTFGRDGFIKVGQYGDIVIKTVIQQGRIWTSYPIKLP